MSFSYGCLIRSDVLMRNEQVVGKPAARPRPTRIRAARRRMSDQKGVRVLRVSDNREAGSQVGSTKWVWQ